MLDLPDQPLIDKKELVGACLRLPLRVDAERLRNEVAALPAALWGTAGGRVGVHRTAEALFLRGYAPAEGEKPVVDREALRALPYVRELIEKVVPASAMRCLLARLPPGATIAPHIDRAPYFWKTLRLHVAVETHDRAWMLCDGFAYVMAPGEVWVLNNNASHAVWNDHATQSRTHLICDFLPSPALLALLVQGERELGRVLPEIEQHVRSAPGAMAAG